MSNDQGRTGGRDFGRDNSRDSSRDSGREGRDFGRNSGRDGGSYQRGPAGGRDGARDGGRDGARSGDRFNRDDRAPRRESFNRDDRGPRRDSFNRDDRAPRREGYNRDDRAPRDGFNRDDRGPRRDSFNRDDRAPRRESFNRDDRGPRRDSFSRDDRGPRRDSFNRDDRAPRREGFNRDDRGGAGERSYGRPDRFGRDQDRFQPRGYSGHRDDRPRDERRDDRRDDRPRGGDRFGRDDRRPARDDRNAPERRSRSGRTDRPKRNPRGVRGAGGEGVNEATARPEENATQEPTTSAPHTAPHTTQRSMPKPDYDAIIEQTGGADGHTDDGVRLQKVLASAGVGSRRRCEVLIEMGAVRVNGQRVTTLGMKVDPAAAIIHVRDRRLEMPDGTITVALNKPKHVVSAMHDPEGRRDLNEFTDDYDERLFHVGRLDYETEGLLIMTNDGELANRLTHPSHEVSKTYLVEVEAPEGFFRRLIKQLVTGVELEDGPAAADKAHVVDEFKGRSIVEITLHEGRNRIVRRMFDAIGYPVQRLVRTSVGPITLGDLRPGESRVITGRELETLRREVRL